MTAVDAALLPTGVVVGTIGVLGLLIGSFLNVVIHRVPAGMSIVSPPSACPGCDHPVRSRDNVPVVSWLLLRGRCRDCAAPISGRYPLVELATALLFAMVAWRFGASVYTVAALAVVAAGVALFMIDLDHKRLPFPITGAAALGTLLALGVDVALHGPDVLVVAALSMGLWLAVYGGIWLGTAGRGMGLGDVAALAVVAAGVALFMIDLDHKRLPFPITGAAALGTLLALGVDVALHGPDVLVVAALSMGLWLAVYGGIWLGTAGRGMGLGDVALAPVLGLALGWLGWGPSVVGLAAGFLIGAVVGVALIATGVTARRARVPHGPFLLTGAALGMFAGEPLWQAYLRLTGLA